jgi:hypothetical protein
MDEVALGALQTTLGQDPLTISEAWVEPQRALYEQVQILNILCQSTPANTEEQILNQVLALMPNHIRSSISPFEVITRWDTWSQEGFPLSCSHPWAD